MNSEWWSEEEGDILQHVLDNLDIFAGVYLFVCVPVKRVVWWEEEEGVWREEEIINLGTLCLAVGQTFTLHESTTSYSIYNFFSMKNIFRNNENIILYVRINKDGGRHN